MIITGYAAVFNQTDLGHDQILPGAFVATFANRSVRNVRMLYLHDPAVVIGQWLEMREDKTGLWVRGDVDTSSLFSDTVAPMIRNGRTAGLSIGFKAVRFARLADGIRQLSEIDLWEVSVTPMPLHPQARILSWEPESSDTEVCGR